MKKSFYSQFFVLCIIVALASSFSAFAQEKSAGKIPDYFSNKIHNQINYGDNFVQQNNFDGLLAAVGYGYGAQVGQTVSLPLPDGMPWTNLAAGPFTAFASSMTRGLAGQYYIVDVGDSLWDFNSTTGAVTYLGLITGMGAESPNGISCNPNNGVYYLASSTNLYSLNVTTFVATLIGPFNTVGSLVIDLCFDFSGTCYAYDLADANAYTIDITTGASTLLGPLGFNPNFGQGMGYDYETGWIYLSAFNNTAFTGELRVMDPVTGYTNLLADFGLNQLAPFSAATTAAALIGPGRATNPTPVNGSTGVVVSGATLNWTNPGGALGSEVWFGTDPNSLTMIYSGPPITSFPVTLSFSTTYYWYVNTQGTGTTPGTMWSFTAEPPACPVSPTPFVEDFELGLFPPDCWSQSGAIWASGSASGYGSGSLSALADFYNVGSGSDDLATFEYDASLATTPTLTFDWAYSTYVNEVDEMDIYYSTDAGATWTLLLAMPGGLSGILNPFGLANLSLYVPANSEWSTMSLALPAGSNMVKFTAISAFGNELYVDNIQVTTELFLDEMDTYIAGQQLACQNPTAWTTWSNLPCDPVEDAFISSNFAFSGANSCVIAPNNDLVKVLGAKTSGKWYMKFAVYIPAGKTGYFNTMTSFTAGFEWGMECYFNAGGAGKLAIASDINFTWLENHWNQVMMVVDLDTQTAEFWFGPGAMSQIATWDWTRGGTVANTLDANDFFGAAATDEMYFDDYYFSDAAPPVIQLSNDVGTVSIDVVTQVAPGTVVPLATVKNYGIATNTFDVQMTITGGYTSTKTVTALAPGATQQVTFDNWTAVTGAYSINVCTQLVGDEDPANDCSSQELYVWDASGVWSSGSSYPTTTYLGGGVGLNGFLYSFSGNTASALNTEAYKYEVATDTWTALSSLPIYNVIFGTAEANGSIYIIGGSDGLVYRSDVYQYDIAADNYILRAPLPLATGWGKAVGYNGTHIYFAGGVDEVSGLIVSTVYVYDVAANTWSTATPMPGGKFGGAFSVVGNQLVYAAGASDAGISDVVYVGTIVNPTTITWVTAANPYPGVNKQLSSINGADLTDIMVSQIKKGNHSPQVVGFPAGSMYRFDGAPWGADGMIVAGGSPTAVWEPADPNPCYVYNPSTDIWTAQENVLAPVLGASLGTVNSGSTWHLVLASGLTTGSANTDTTQIFTDDLGGGGSTFSLSVSVLDGWNMVSIPGLHPTDQNVLTWWPGKDPAAAVFGFSGSYSVVTTVAPGAGYWMKHSGANVYDTGDEWPAINIVTHDPIPAIAGWNLIGGYENIATTSLITTTPSGLVTGPVFGFSGGYSVATTLEPGFAYWIKLTAAGDINIPSTLLSKSGAEPIEYFKEEWGRIIITDKAGRTFVLYAVTEDVSLDNYEMPPAPPEGSFDIRFSSNRIAEDINTAIQTIEMSSGVEYPIIVRVENMDIRIQDESGRLLNEVIESGQQLTINSRLDKLVVTGELVPEVYSLEQNYPNPFNPSTVIEFSLPENASNVRLTIYNALGEKVAELVNTTLEAGKYSYQWDATNVATGMYIYELRTNNFVSVKKMLLMK